MPILAWIAQVIGPLTGLVSNLHTSDAEKETLKNQLASIQNEMASKLLAYESQLLSSQADIIKAEAQGASWMQRNWRPITMFVFLILTVFDSFGWLPNRLAPQAWTLLQLGLGGYVVGRSMEKIAPQVASVLNGDKNAN